MRSLQLYFKMKYIACRAMGSVLIHLHIFTKGNNFREFLLAFLDDVGLFKIGSTLEGMNFHLEGHFSPLKTNTLVY